MLKSRWGNFVAANQAIAPFTFLQSFQSSFDAQPLCLPSSLSGQCHRLNLHSVNTGKAADAILVELDRIPIRGADTIFLFEVGAAAQEPFARSGCVHDAQLISETEGPAM